MLIAERDTIQRKCVRVAVTNNFNCTKPEWKQLNDFAESHLGSVFFINCNVYIPLLKTVNDHPYKVVITFNPRLKFNTDNISKIHKVSQDKIAFIRVKYIPNLIQVKEYIKKLSSYVPVVVTNQRWNGKRTLAEYSLLDFYKWSHNRYRLHGEYLRDIVDFVDSESNVFLCDRLGIGCPGCKLCSMLITGENLPLFSLNLSTSGICPYNCPDCYAKTLQHFATCCGHKPITFDKIMQNHKQKGATAHALAAKMLLNA